MKYRPFVYLTFLLLAMSISLRGQEIPVFEESEGLVVIEAESAGDLTGWSQDTVILPFTGDGYLLYLGSNHFNDPGFAKITYQILVSKAGRYRFQWRSRIGQGTENTEHNDSWLRFQDAAKFYAEKEGMRLYPGGTGLSPNPNGSSLRGWFKIYQNRFGDWTWQTRTSDHDPHEIYVEFDSAGMYTMEISGRSKGHAIDRIILYDESVRSVDAQNLAQPESNRPSTVSKKDVSFVRLSVTPNPTTTSIRTELPQSFDGKNGVIMIFDMSGRVLFKKRIDLIDAGEIVTPVDFLPIGNYGLQVKSGEQVFLGSFTKG